MANTSKSIAKALLSLSNNIDLVDTRKALLQSLTDDKLEDVTEHCMRELMSRNELEDVLCSVLDRTVQEPSHPEAEVIEATSSIPVRAESSPIPSEPELKDDTKPTVLRAGTSTPQHSDEFGFEVFLRIVTCKFGEGRPFWYENTSTYPLLQQRLADRISTDFFPTRKQAVDFVNHTTPDVCADIFVNFKGKAISCTFLMSDRKTGYSCDSCIDRGKLCVRPVYFNFNPELVVYPLPRRLRKGRLAKNEYFWVRE